MCNKIEVFPKHSEIVINSRKHGVHRVLIDTDKIDEINKYKWVLSIHDKSVFYIVARQKGENKNIQLHRYLTKCPKGLTVDHINRNPLDNRMCNLRICTQSENNLNKGMRSDNTTGYKNISIDKRTGKYRVTFSRDKTWKQIGTYKSLKEAIKYRDSYLTTLI